MNEKVPKDLATLIQYHADDIIFHLEPKNGWITTYGSSTAPVVASGVHIETRSGFFDNKFRECIRADEDVALGTITIKDNLFAECEETRHCTMMMWIFVSDMKNTTSFHPYTGGANNEFLIDPKTLIYRTDHYYSGITYKNVIPNNRWCHVMLSISNSDHMKSRLSLYVDGRIISTGYTNKDYTTQGTSTSTSVGFGIDFRKLVKNSVTNKWEFFGNPGGGLYFLREFTIFRGSLILNDQWYIPPQRSVSAICPSMILSNRLKLGYFNIGSVDPEPSLSGPVHGVMLYSGGERMKTSGSTQDPLFYYEDSKQYIGTVTKTFTLSGWSGRVDTSTGTPKALVTIWIIAKYIKHVTQDQSSDLLKPGTEFESQDGIKGFSGQIKIFLNGREVKRSKYFTYNKVDSYFEFDDKITELVNINTPNTLRIETGTMPINNQRVWIMNYEGDIEGGLRKAVLWDIYSRLVVPEYWMSKDINPCKIVVDNTGKHPSDGPTPHTKKKFKLTLEIPFPYPQFTEMQWILIAPDGRFIPEIFYDRVDEYHIKFKNWDPFNAGLDQFFKFTFLHKHGFYAVNKFEQSVYATAGVKSYQFNSPYDNIVDLQKRVKVFINCEFLNPNIDLYSFDNNTGRIKFSNKFPFKTGDLITFLCFYTGTKQADKTIARLPMSGYVEFRTQYEDRVWDKDSFAIFMNGKLVSRDDITDMSSTIHKINRDIKTRYNLEVLNMAPRISYLSPYILAAHKKIESKEVIWEIPGTLKVPSSLYRPRFYIEPDIFNPVEWKAMVPTNMDWYITLVHHGLNKAEKDYQQNLTYTLSFYKDEYEIDPQSVAVVGQVRLKGNIEEFHPDHDTNTLIGMLPATLYNISEDMPLLCIQAKEIYLNDTLFDYDKYGESIDGIMCRLEILQEKKDRWFRVFYELVCDNYERDTEIEILEWVISSEPNAKGDIWYRKTIPFLPFDTPNFPPLD